MPGQTGGDSSAVMQDLSAEHIAAVERRRRVVVNFDVGFAVNTSLVARPEVAEFITRLFPFYGEKDRVSAEQDRLLDAVWQGIRAVRAGETAGNVDVLESWLERADLPTDLRVGGASEVVRRLFPFSEAEDRYLGSIWRTLKGVRAGQMVSGVDVLRSSAWMNKLGLAIDPLAEYGSDLSALVEHLFTFADDASVHIDSIWWNWSEGNEVPFASKRLPMWDHPLYRKLADEGTDIVQVFLEETRGRGKEVFYSHRMNGSDYDLGSVRSIPMKEAHPEWLFRTPWGSNGYWNFALPEVREHVLGNLREVAEGYDFDGMELDFARGVVLPAGQQWNNRDALTEFIRSVRSMLLELERGRGRPFLLAARVPENLPGCHFDGLDVETWAADRLVDMFTLGCRSFDVDVAAFRTITAGTNIKLYPALDEHHACDGYHHPGIEVLRGVVSEWWWRGADGVQTFNFSYAPESPYGGEDWQDHLALYRELDGPETLRRKHKTFVVQRRGGGHGEIVVPNAESWSTPRHSYANSNMLAQLPAPLAGDGKADTVLTLAVADDLAREAEHIEAVSLALLLSDPAAADLPASDRLEQVTVATIGHPGGELSSTPPERGIEERTEVTVNNPAWPRGGKGRLAGIRGEAGAVRGG